MAQAAEKSSKSGERVRQLVERYFSDSRRTVLLDTGDVLLREGRPNDRLYYVRFGRLVGASGWSAGGSFAMVEAAAGEFVGVRSFADPDVNSHVTLEAAAPTEVAYATMEDIRSLSGEQPEQVLMPIFTQALVARQALAYRVRAQEEENRRRMDELTEMSQLGQFSAGVAHELNNAISVIDRGADWLSGSLKDALEKVAGAEEYQAFLLGLERGRRIRSQQARTAAKILQKHFGLSFSEARQVAQMGLSEDTLKRLSGTLGARASSLRSYWELGATFRDLSLAAEQASSVVESMRNLGARSTKKETGTNVHDSIDVAMTILGKATAGVEVECRLDAADPTVLVNKGELVQIWVNLIRNACDALRATEPRASRIPGGERPPAPEHRVLVKTRDLPGGLEVVVRDNGPGIPEQLLGKIFQPNFTTKKSGLSFGLGLGLSIVRRILVAAGGGIEASNDGNGAVFTVTLPREGQPAVLPDAGDLAAPQASQPTGRETSLDPTTTPQSGSFSRGSVEETR